LRAYSNVRQVIGHKTNNGNFCGLPCVGNAKEHQRQHNLAMERATNLKNILIGMGADPKSVITSTSSSHANKFAAFYFYKK